jgi:hypothetical protein
VREIPLALGLNARDAASKVRNRPRILPATSTVMNAPGALFFFGLGVEQRGRERLLKGCTAFIVTQNVKEHTSGFKVMRDQGLGPDGVGRQDL